MVLLAIDPGLTGAVCKFELNKENFSIKSIDLKPMPRVKKLFDTHEFNKMIKNLIPSDLGIEIHASLEAVSSRPMQGVSSVFKFGRTYGQIEGVLVANFIPYTLISPVKWTKTMHAGIENSGMDAKAKSLMAVKRLFPKVNLLATERSKKPHDGFIDALLLAEFSRRQLLRLGSV